MPSQKQTRVRARRTWSSSERCMPLRMVASNRFLSCLSPRIEPRRRKIGSATSKLRVVTTGVGESSEGDRDVLIMVDIRWQEPLQAPVHRHCKRQRRGHRSALMATTRVHRRRRSAACPWRAGVTDSCLAGCRVAPTLVVAEHASQDGLDDDGRELVGRAPHVVACLEEVEDRPASR